MKCYCVETDHEFILNVEEYDEQITANIEAAWFVKNGDKYTKTYPSSIENKDSIKVNFPRLGESLFSGKGNWSEALKTFSKACSKADIRWYITGSVCEAVAGVNISPHDIDIVTHVDDFYKIRDLFLDFMVEPFVDNKGNWVVRYFGRLCIEGVMFDIVADEKRNAENHHYDTLMWDAFELKIEPIAERYKIELQRERMDRIKAFDNYFDSLK